MLALGRSACVLDNFESCVRRGVVSALYRVGWLDSVVVPTNQHGRCQAVALFGLRGQARAGKGFDFPQRALSHP